MHSRNIKNSKIFFFFIFNIIFKGNFINFRLMLQNVPLVCEPTRKKTASQLLVRVPVKQELKPTMRSRPKLAACRMHSAFTSSTSNTYLIEPRPSTRRRKSQLGASLHLSMPKLNFEASTPIRARSDSNLCRSNRMHHSRAPGKYKIIFDRRPTCTQASRSNSCLLVSSSFEASHKRLIRIRQIQTAQLGIETEMDKLLASSKGNKMG